MTYKPRTYAGASAKALFEDLVKLQYHGVMFGHQDASLTGCMNLKSKWTAMDHPMYDPDVFQVAQQYPAVYGFDFGWLTDPEAYPVAPHLFDNKEEAFQIHQDLALQCHNAGGILTFSWHVSNAFSRTAADLLALQEGKGKYKGDDKVKRREQLYRGQGQQLIGSIDPAATEPPQESSEEPAKAMDVTGDLHTELKSKLDIIADFANSLKDGDGAPVPILFRPWHENNLDWWWWGWPNPDADYRALWRATVEYLDAAGVTTFLYVFSPNVVRSPLNSSPTPEEQFRNSFEDTYPGADLVDVLGIDLYPRNLETKVLLSQVDYLCKRAREEGKLAAITECGLYQVARNGAPVNDYWTKEYIAPFWEKDENLLSYALAWKNVDPEKEYWCTFPGQGSEADFRRMAVDSTTLLRSGRRFRTKVLFRDEVVAKRAAFARWRPPQTP